MFSFLPEDSPTITAGVASTCCFFLPSVHHSEFLSQCHFSIKITHFTIQRKTHSALIYQRLRPVFHLRVVSIVSSQGEGPPKSSVNPSKFPERVVGAGAPRSAWGRPSPRPSTHAHTHSHSPTTQTNTTHFQYSTAPFRQTTSAEPQ